MKAVIIVDEALPAGLAANAAAVLGASLGALRPAIIGPDLRDRSGRLHRGITGLPIPVLGASKGALAELVARAEGAGHGDETLVAVGFTDLAQNSLSYADYEGRLAGRESETLDYRALLLVGEKSAVNALAGALPLLGKRR